MSQPNQSLQTAALMARVAGLAYLCYTLAGFYMNFGPVPGLRVFVEGDPSADQLEFMFRTSLATEALLYTFVAISAAAMYATLREVSFGIAAIAAFTRLIEAAMGGAFIAFKYAAFAAATNETLLTGFSAAERAGLASFIAHLYGYSVFFLLIPMAAGGMLFFGLFFRARFLPRWLAAWGVFTYVVIGSVATLVLVFPDLRNDIMLFFLPGAVFELVVAVWLLFLGINTQYWQKSIDSKQVAS
tara:strand:- start:650 stop:1378 length:729 start_codon:yes stop_codon:yes gene_type:complete